MSSKRRHPQAVPWTSTLAVAATLRVERREVLICMTAIPRLEESTGTVHGVLKPTISMLERETKITGSKLERGTSMVVPLALLTLKLEGSAEAVWRRTRRIIFSLFLHSCHNWFMLLIVVLFFHSYISQIRNRPSIRFIGYPLMRTISPSLDKLPDGCCDILIYAWKGLGDIGFVSCQLSLKYNSHTTRPSTRCNELP